MRLKKILCSTLALVFLQLAGCAKDLPPGEYDSSEVGKIKKVVPGVIISKRPVNIHNKSNENGLAPAETNYSMNRSHGMEYVIKLNSGAIISVVQAEDLNLKSKQHVLVIYGDNTRVMPDDGSDS